MARKRVMISYSHKDTEIVIVIEKSLRLAGIEIWRDDQIPLGHDWLETILKEIETSDHLLLILSPNSINSYYVLVEELYGRFKDKLEGKEGFIIPILIKPCELPVELKRIQLLDLTDPTARVASIQLLANTIIGSERRAIEKNQGWLSETNLFSLLVSISIVEGISYWTAYNLMNPNFAPFLVSLCISAVFSFFIVIGFVRATQLRSSRLLVLSLVAGLIGFWPWLQGGPASLLR